MALIKCPECGDQVSDKAAACPHCGAPVEAKNDGEPTCKLTVHRRASGSMSARRFRISVDGEPALTGVNNGDSAALLVTAGKHRVSFLVGDEELGSIDVTFQDDEDVELICWGDGQQILAKRKRDAEPAPTRTRTVSSPSPLVPQSALGSAAVQQKPQKKGGWVGVMALLLLVVGLSILISEPETDGGTKRGGATSEAAQSQKKDYEDTPFSEIYYAYQVNELRADGKYQFKRFKLTGTVVAVNSDGLANLTGGATLTTEKQIGNTRAFLFAEFEKEQESAVKRINVGDTITFTGECIGWGQWDECEIWP